VSRERHRLRLIRMCGLATILLRQGYGGPSAVGQQLAASTTTGCASRGAGSQEGIRQAPLWSGSGTTGCRAAAAALLSACREASPWSDSIAISIPKGCARWVQELGEVGPAQRAG
jgi:hypothetical protein